VTTQTLARAWRALSLAGLALLSLAVASCNRAQEEALPAGSETAAESPPMAADTAAAEEAMPADHILVQHVLVGFAGSVPGKTITRTQAEAEKLANDLLARARAGEDFGALVQQYTDDQYPGIYGLANDGVAPAENEYPRNGMVKGFSDAAFRLRTGEVGVAVYDKATSPYGWHVIKRID
jgi:hypothetical protein